MIQIYQRLLNYENSTLLKAWYFIGFGWICPVEIYNFLIGCLLPRRKCLGALTLSKTNYTALLPATFVFCFKQQKHLPTMVIPWLPAHLCILLFFFLIGNTCSLSLKVDDELSCRMSKGLHFESSYPHSCSDRKSMHVMLHQNSDYIKEQQKCFQQEMFTLCNSESY